MLDIYDLYSEIGYENLTADTIIGTMDDADSGRVGSFGWSCVMQI